MKLPHLLFGLVLAMAASLLAVLFGTDAPPGAAGLPHLVHRPMLRGGAGLARVESVILTGWLLGSLGVAFFAACFALGVRRRDRRMALLIAGAALVYEIVWTLLVLLYWQFAQGESTQLYFALPAPTAWLFYVFTPAPALFLVLYLVKFDAFMPPDSELDRLRRERQDKDSGDSR